MIHEDVHKKKKVIITVLDRDDTKMGSFEASKYESILDTAEKNNLDIGYSCRNGACFACACHVSSGYPYIDLGKFWYPLVDIDEWDCLTCIGGISDDTWNNDNDVEITIKKF